MSATVRLWSKEDLQAIKEGKDNLLATIFMNVKTFSEDQIRVYPYDRRKCYTVSFAFNDEMDAEDVTVYATDDKALRQFLEMEYDTSYICCITEVIYNFRDVAIGG